MLRITTETELGKREMRSAIWFSDFAGFLLLAMGLFLAMVLFISWQAYSANVVNRITSIFFIVMCFFGSLVGFLESRLKLLRGYWDMDDEKILYTSLKGKSRILFWKDINAILFNRDRFYFRGPGKVFQIVLQYEDDERRSEAQDFIRERLKDSFEFSEQPKISLTWRIALLCLVMSLSGGLPIVFILALNFMLEESSFCRGAGLLFGYTMITATAYYFGRKEFRKEWRFKIKPVRNNENGS